MKKILAITIALLMLLTALVACGGGDGANGGDAAGGSSNNGGNTDVGPGATSSAETDSWGQIKEENEVPEDLDYEGMKIGVASRPETRYRREISVETPADPLDMKIFLRNQQTEQYLNVKLNYIEAAELWGNSASANIPNYVKTEYSAGAESDVDIIFGNGAYTVDPAMRGYLVNLAGDNAPFLKVDKLYWNQSYVQNSKCYGQLYYIVGDLTLTIYDKAMVDYVNLDKAAAAGITAESLYQHVYDGTWTYDTFLEIVENYTYMDNNSNQTVDEGDDIRISTIFQSEAADGYYFAFDLSVMNTDATTGAHTVNIDGNTKLSNAAEKIAYLYSLGGIFHGSTETAFERFIEGDVLFLTDILYRNEWQNKDLRNSTFNYGILPLPKYDTDQETYHTSAQDAYNAISILKTHTDKLEACSAFLEVMASKSYDDVRPFYIEKMVKAEYANDADSVAMIKYVMDGLVFDPAWIYSFQVDRYAYNIWRGPACGTTTVSEQWAKIQQSAIDAVKTFDLYFQGTQGQ